MKALSLFLLLVCSTVLFGQNRCDSAVVVGSLPFHDDTTTCKGAINGSINPCGLKGEGYAYYYSFTADHDMTVQVQVERKEGIYPRMYAALTLKCKLDSCLFADFDESTGKIIFTIRLTKDIAYNFIVYSDVYSTSGEDPKTYNCFGYLLDIIEIVGDGEGGCKFHDIDKLNYLDKVQTNCTESRQLASYGCGINKVAGGKDYLYRYVPKPGETCLNAKAVSNYGGSFLGAFRGCPTPNNCIVTNTSFSVYDTAYIELNVIPGIPVYFLVSPAFGSDTNCIEFDFQLNLSPIKTENCPAAVNVTAPYFYTEFHFRCKDYAYPAINKCQSWIPHDADFYKISSPGNQCLSIVADDDPYSDKIKMMLFKGCPYDSGAVCITSSWKYFINDPDDYYVLFAPQYINDLENHKARFYITDEVDLAANCQNTRNFSSFPVNETISIANCMRGISFPCCEDSDPRDPSITYSFTVPADGCYEVAASGSTDIAYIVLSDSCVNGVFHCSNSVLNNRTANISMRSALIAGRTYYVTVAKSQFQNTYAKITLTINPVDSSGNDCILCTQDSCSTCQYSGVETSDFNGWDGYTGTFSDPLQDPGIPSGGVNSSKQISIVSGDGRDMYGGFPMVNPNGGKYSIRLGDYNSGKGSATLQYTYLVEPDAELFTYYYAVVLQDPGHDPAEQPRFTITTFTSNGDTIFCGNYDVTAGGNIPDFKSNADMRYKDWSAVAIPVKSYRGQTIIVQFQVKDCSRGDHLGYAYLDAACMNADTMKTFNCDGRGSDLIGPLGFKSYLWNTGDTTKDLHFVNSGNYELTATTFTDCVIKFPSVITDIKTPPFSIGPDTSICAYDSTTFDATFPSATFYVWNTGDTTAKFTTHNAGIYSVIVGYDSPCMLYDTAIVSRLLTPVLRLRDTSLCYYDSMMVKTNWTNGDFLWSTGETTDSIRGYPDNEYILTVTSTDGCVVSDSTRIIVETECPEIYVPNCFTIDGDNLNEIFKPISVEMTINELRIYNRWGEMIINIPGPEPSWDGNAKGEQCKQDVYEWQILYTSPRGEKGSKVGHVTLLRFK